jgi:hypothetical protein
VKTATTRFLLLFASTVGSSYASASAEPMPQALLRQVGRIFTNPTLDVWGKSHARPRDAEGLAYVPRDESIWLADDNRQRLYEFSSRCSTVKRAIEKEDLAKARKVGDDSVLAGERRAWDMEGLAYDAQNDALYVFAGKCCDGHRGVPTVFKLTRSASGRFEVGSFQPLDEPLNDFSGASAFGGEIWAALGSKIYRYDYSANQFSEPVDLTGKVATIYGMGFSSDGKDLWVTTAADRLVLIDWRSRAPVPGFDFDTRGLGIKDARAVEVVEGKLYICDGSEKWDETSQNRYSIEIFELLTPREE